jgi:hypothetical protein
MRAFPAAVAALVLSGLAFADLKVMDTEDVVHLVSGEEVRGTVLAVGIKAVIVVVENKERVIPRREVASIERGELRPTIKGYQTDVVEGIKLVTGEGFRDSDAEGGEQAVAEGPAAARSRKAAGRGKGARRGKGGEPLISEEKADELMDDPEARKLVEKLGGREKAMEMARKYQDDPQYGPLIRQFLKSGKLPPGLDKIFR